MKVRNGYVSNSSSSSFILKVSGISNIDDLQRTLYSGKPPLIVTYGNDIAIPTDDVLERIYHDITQEKNVATNAHDLVGDIREELGDELSKVDVDIIVGMMRNSPTTEDAKEVGRTIAELEKELAVEWNNFVSGREKEIDSEAMTQFRNRSRPTITKIKEKSNKLYNLLEDSLSQVKERYATVEYGSDGGHFYESYIELSGLLDPITLVRFSYH